MHLKGKEKYNLPVSHTIKVEELKEDIWGTEEKIYMQQDAKKL